LIVTTASNEEASIASSSAPSRAASAPSVTGGECTR
jgi:hypothetical protein